MNKGVFMEAVIGGMMGGAGVMILIIGGLKLYSFDNDIATFFMRCSTLGMPRTSEVKLLKSQVRVCGDKET